MVNTKNLSSTHIVRQGEGNIVSDMDGEKVMLSINKGKYYNLGGMGGVIWDLMNVPISITNLVDSLVSQYEVEQSECEEQVFSFLNLLHDEGLIHTEEISTR